MSVSKAQPKVTRTFPQEGLSVYSSFPNSTESTAMTCNVNRLLVYTCYEDTKDIRSQSGSSGVLALVNVQYASLEGSSSEDCHRGEDFFLEEAIGFPSTEGLA